MKKVSKIIASILLLGLTFISCGQRQFDRYNGTFHELTRDSKSRKLQGNENDIIDLSGCQMDYELDQWRISKISKDLSTWSRHSSSMKFDGIVTSGNIYLDLPTKRGYKNLDMILQDKSKYLVYVGPWHQITLFHKEGSFFNSRQITEQKQIRFFAYQPKEGGRIEYQYESMTEENKNIPEKKFSLSPTAKYAPDKFSLCVVKWTAKYGYNAVVDLHKNPWFPFFTREYLTGSGKIIDSETGEVIADEKGNFVNQK